MPITIKVNGTSHSLVHKMSNGLSTATIPDVCKTPTPGGPVPMPYPNIAQSVTLANGTTTVKGDRMTAANKGSKFALSNGDNPGVAGGVKSSTFMKEATWILYSFDVKVDGKNACRFTDKMFHNSENAANLGGEIQIPRMVGHSQADLEDLAIKCNERVNRANGFNKRNPPKGKVCTKLGQEKHKCCEDAINKYNKSNPDSPLRSEVGFDAAGKALTQSAEAAARVAAAKAYDAAVAAGTAFLTGAGLPAAAAGAVARTIARVGKVWANAYFKGGGGVFRADVLVVQPPGAVPTKTPPPGTIKGAFEFKFHCGKKGKPSETQNQNYDKFTGQTPTPISILGNSFG
jgi:hypothetical protein